MDDTIQARVRWFQPTPGRFVIGLLAVEALLFLSQWFRWLPKGWPVLIAFAAVGLAVLGMFVWFGVALVFGRRFQFSLRALLVLTVAVAVPCSWLAVEKQKKREHREAVAGIYRSGGYVAYSYENGRWLPYWLLKLFGEEPFGDIQGIDFCGSHVTDEDLQYLERLDSFGMLVFSDNHITDAGLGHLRGSTQLYWLTLSGLPISDVGLKHLEGLVQLQHLALDGTEVSDAGLKYLTGLTQLSELFLDDTKVTDAGVAKLQDALPNCKITR